MPQSVVGDHGRQRSQGQRWSPTGRHQVTGELPHVVRLGEDDLDLGVVRGPDAAPGRLVVRAGRGRDAAQGQVRRVGEPQQQTLSQVGRDRRGQQRAITGEHHDEAVPGPVAQEAGQGVLQGGTGERVRAGEDGVPPIDEDQDGRVRVVGGNLGGHGGVQPGGEQLQETQDATRVGTRHASAAVGQGLEVAEPAVSVDDVQVQLVRGVSRDRLDRDAPQQARAAGPVGPDHGEVTTGLQVVVPDRLLLLVREVHQAQGQGAVAVARAWVGREVGGVDEIRQRREPGTGRSGPSHGRLAGGANEGRELGVWSVPGGGHASPVLELHRHVAGRDESRRSGPRGLKGSKAPVAGPPERATGQPVADPGRVGCLDDVLGVGAVTHAQGDASVDVGTDVGRDDTCRSLRREHEVDAQGATDRGDGEQPRHEVRELLRQDPELVDDDHQPGHERVAGPADPLVGLQVGRAGSTQGTLAAGQLGAQRGEGSTGEVGVEVRDESCGVRQGGALGEGRPTLVVEQHEGELVRRQRESQPRDEGLQQLGLAGPGGAADEHVRAVGGEVEGDRAACRAAERCEGVPGGPGPGRGHVGRAVQPDGADVGQGHQVGGDGRRARGGRPQGRERSRQLPRHVGSDRVGDGARDQTSARHTD